MTRRSRSVRTAAGAEVGVDDPLTSGDSALRWPASALIRWEERKGPRDVWTILPFPRGGSGVLYRLLDATSSSKLFRGRSRLSVTALTLSAELSVGGALQLFPLKDDEDVEQAIQLTWKLCPGTEGVVPFAVSELGAADEAGTGALPFSLLLGGGGPLSPSPPATIGNTYPIDAWTCVLNAVISSRCVGFLAPSLPPASSRTSTRIQPTRGCFENIAPIPSPEISMQLSTGLYPSNFHPCRAIATRPGTPPHWPACAPMPRWHTGRDAGKTSCALNATGSCSNPFRAPST